MDGFRPRAGLVPPPPFLSGGEFSPNFPQWQGTSKNGPRSFSPLPPTGVHPRLFFTPEDLPAMRRQLLGDDLQGREGEIPGGWVFNDVALRGPDPVGLLPVTSYLFTRDAVEKRYPYGPPPLFTGPVAPVYERLAAGDLTVDITTVKLYGTNVASAGQGRDGMYGKLSGAGFVSLIQEGGNFDRVKLATALATTCTLHTRVYVQGGPGFLHDVSPDLGIAYDMLAGAMTAPQRSACVTLMGNMIRGRNEIGHGSFQRRPWITNLNHVGWHCHAHIVAHAMEGEFGVAADEGNIWRRTMPIGVDVQRKFISHTITEGGLGRESGGYFSMGWYWALPVNVIFARRGFNAFADPTLGPRFYRSLLFFFNAQVPLTAPENNWDGRHHDDLVSTQRPRYQCMMAWIYGDDELAQRQLANSQPHQAPPSGEALICAMFGALNSRGRITAAEAAAAKGIPLTHFDRDKGELFVRNSWAPDAFTVNFESRLDTYRVGHVHASRNSFYVYALGRSWIIDQMAADTENVGHSTILIDGVGQSGGGDAAGNDFWPSFPAMWNAYSDSPRLTIAAADAQYAYAYSLKCRPHAGYPACVANTFRPGQFGYQPDPYVAPWMVTERYMGWANLNVFNPVARAYRTVVVAKGARPFLLVVDDIQKDTATHAYEWVANVPLTGGHDGHQKDNVVADRALSGGADLVLRSSNDPLGGSPRLLVRLVSFTGVLAADGVALKDRTARIRKNKVASGGGNFSPTEAIRTVSITVRSVEPGFVVLCWPFRQGEALPETSVSEDRNTVTVDGRRFALARQTDGRTRVTER